MRSINVFERANMWWLQFGFSLKNFQRIQVYTSLINIVKPSGIKQLPQAPPWFFSQILMGLFHLLFLLCLLRRPVRVSYLFRPPSRRRDWHNWYCFHLLELQKIFSDCFWKYLAFSPFLRDNFLELIMILLISWYSQNLVENWAKNYFSPKYINLS